jgi:outer membrane immunogenic protein
MRKFTVTLLATAALGFTVCHASAADLPVSGLPGPPLPGPPPYFVAPPHVWTNLYVGLNGGGTFDSRFSLNSTFGPFTADLGSVSGNGFLGGGQVGAQIQYQWTVLGIEADFQGSSQDHSDTFDVFGIPLTVSESMPWFGTVRGRIGWALNNVLLYGTGGIAVVDGKLSGSALGLTLSKENSHVGWTAGGGVEWAFAPHWTVKAEYLYLDSGNIEIDNVDGVTFNGRIKDNIVRAGINYYIFN